MPRFDVQADSSAKFAEGRSMSTEPPDVSTKTRWLLYAGAWGTAIFGCTFLGPIFRREIPSRDAVLIPVMFSWLFPAGLIAWFDGGSPDKPGNIPWIVLIWLAYLVHGVVALRSHARFRFYCLLLILAIVMAFNVVGCNRILSTPVRFG